MDYKDFREWLVSNKNMTRPSAGDVISRIKRVIKLTKLEPESNIEIIYEHLDKNIEFNKLSLHVKLQLKRSIKLLNDYEEFKVNEE